MSGGGAAALRIEDEGDLPQDPAGRRFAVPRFELAERLIARGADSACVAVADEPGAVTWPEDGGPWVPARPYSFGGRCVVVLPTYNERENLAPMVDAIGRYLDTDVLVVDDGSPDGTGALADELAAASPRLAVLHRAAKEGLGPAYLAGFRRALAGGYERVVAMDCDFSHAPWDLPRLVHASGEADLVIGSRYVAGGATPAWSVRRRLLSRGGNLYASLLLGGGIRDWTAGFRCFRASLLARLDLAAIRARGYSFQIEMAWAARRAGAVVREVPVRFTDRTRGESKMSGAIAFEALRRVAALRLERRR